MLEVGERQRRRQGSASGFVRDIVAAVDYMNRCLKAGAELAETSANCLVIYYEDTISDPLGVANRMYRFIGVQETDRLDLENEQFKAARNQESWIDWSAPGTISGGVEKDRVGIAEKRLKRSEWEYVCAKTIRHPLLTERYSMGTPEWTAGARWCLVRTMAMRIRKNAPALLSIFRRRLTG
jgi:hypothetical protein